VTYAYVIIFFASVVDFICTKILFDRNGLIEVNPVMNGILQSSHNIWNLLIFKFLILIMLGIGIQLENKRMNNKMRMFIYSVAVIQLTVAFYGAWQVLMG
jgi:Domain of unknown function (DUF5658)